MKYKFFRTSRTAHAPADIRVIESPNFAPSGYYIDMRINLFRCSPETIWSEETAEGKAIMERKAITNEVLDKFDFDIAIEINGNRCIFAECHKGKGAAYTTAPEFVRFLFAVPNTAEGIAGVNAIRSGQAQGCNVDYDIYFDNPDYVRRRGRLKAMKMKGKTILLYRIKQIADLTGVTITTKTTRLQIENLRNYCLTRIPIWQLKIFGIEHFDRVAESGKLLLVSGASPDVVAAFAYLHDIERNSNETDTKHGSKAAMLIRRIRETHLAELTNTEIDLLIQACQLHGNTHKTGNATIDICLDADRLDLPRLGIIPSPEEMATEKGALLAAKLSPT